MSRYGHIAAVVLGAGMGLRYQSSLPKVYHELSPDYSLLERSVGQILSVLGQTARLIVTIPDMSQLSLDIAMHIKNVHERIAEHYPTVQYVSGGDSRMQSVSLAMECISDITHVLVHDGARAAIHHADIQAVLDAGATGEHAGYILARSVTDTTKIITESGEIRQTIDRDQLRLAETPQLISVSAYHDSLSQYRAKKSSVNITDDASLLECAGYKVQTVLATYPNPKLTQPLDMEYIKYILKYS